jgi:glutaredoxin
MIGLSCIYILRKCPYKVNSLFKIRPSSARISTYNLSLVLCVLCEDAPRLLFRILSQLNNSAKFRIKDGGSVSNLPAVPQKLYKTCHEYHFSPTGAFVKRTRNMLGF